MRPPALGGALFGGAGAPLLELELQPAGVLSDGCSAYCRLQALRA